MGLMDMLSPFATGFLEKRVEQQDAREKYIAESNKLRDKTLSEIAKNKKMLIDEKNINIHFDEVERKKQEEALLAMYEGSMNPVLFNWLKDNKYFYNDEKWKGFSQAFKDNAGGSELWFKTKVVGSDKSWEDHMIEQLQQPLTKDEIKDGAKEGMDLGPNTTQFMLDVQDQPFSLLDARSINPVKFQEYQTAATGLKKSEIELGMLEWDAEHQNIIGQLDIELQNQQKDINDEIIAYKKLENENKPNADKINNLLKQSELTTKNMNIDLLKEKNPLLIDQLKVNIANIKQTMSFAEASQDLNLQKLEAQVNNLVIEGQLQEIDLETAGPINAARLHGMQLANIEQAIKNKTVGEHEKEILNNIIMRNEILEKDIGKYDEETQNTFALQKLQMEKLQKEIDAAPKITLLKQGEVTKGVENGLGEAIGAPSSSTGEGPLQTITWNWQLMDAPWIGTIKNSVISDATKKVQEYQDLIKTNINYQNIEPRQINMDNISRRLLGEKLQTQYTNDMVKINNRIKKDFESRGVKMTANIKTELMPIVQKIMSNPKYDATNDLKEFGIVQDVYQTFWTRADGKQSNSSYWNDAMIATLNKYKAGDYSDQYDIISSTLN